MENNVGVGIIVGIATATSLYVWNSNSFTKSQKTFLLLSILFPPLQWISILLVLAYNKYQLENTIEAKAIKQNIESSQNLDSAKNNLLELKEKGIITNEEFNSKVETIEKQKTEFNIKNSIEYKQLKSLLDSGILTKEEFENKVKLISNISCKEIDEKEINDIVNSVNETYLAEIEEKPKPEDKSSTPIYIFSILFFVLLLGGIVFYSDKYNETSVDSTYSEPMVIDTTAMPIEQISEPIKIRKFVYVVMEVEKPNLNVYTPIARINSMGYSDISEPIYTTEYLKETYSTDIVEIEDYNEDEKYRFIDDAKGKMRSQLIRYDDVNNMNMFVKCKDERKREEFKKESSKIIDAQIYEFESYAEASINKQKN
jgi:uncharacterized membrane protein